MKGNIQAALGFLIFILIAAGVVGYAMNIYKLVTVCDFEAPYKCEAIRVGGLFPPVGAIAGYVDLGE